MKANELTWGVEIECLVNRGACELGQYHHGMPVAWMPAGWTAERDGSLGNGTPTKMPVEFVSPILKGEEGLRSLAAALEAIRAHGGKSTNLGGFHVHVYWPADAQASQWKRLLNTFAYHEAAIYAASGTKRRENGHYCRPMHDTYANVDRTDRAQLTRAAGNRYQSLNLTNTLGGIRPTAEIRAWGSTVNTIKAMGYVTMALAVVERAMESRGTVPYDAKPAGSGAKALSRFFKCYGWTNAKRQRWGVMEPAGLPTLEQRVRELARLAEKYDRTA